MIQTEKLDFGSGTVEDVWNMRTFLQGSFGKMRLHLHYIARLITTITPTGDQRFYTLRRNILLIYQELRYGAAY